MIRYPKPLALAQLPAAGGVIEASAGTGKTYTLERLVVDLLLEGLKLEEILVVTFTEKATLEINTRVRKMLEELLALETTPEGTGEPAWELGAEAREALAAALRSFDRATISTIHGFCRQVLQDSAFEGGGLFRQELADGRTLFGRAFKDLLRTDFCRGGEADFLREVTRDGAWTLPRLEAFLWDVCRERGRVTPEALDFDRLMASFPQELSGRQAAIDQALGALPHKVVNSSRRATAQKALPELFNLFAGASGTESALGWLRKFDGLPPESLARIAEVCAATSDPDANRLADWLSEALARWPTSEALVAHTLLGPIRARLQALKETEGLYDFDDMVLRVRDALASGPSSEPLARRLAARFRAALIDEFQDTDEAQWDIFRRVFLDQGLRLYVIGDPKQGIYGFRGGDLPTYLAARQALLGDGTPPVALQENFRSTPAVIAAYNHLLTHPEPPFFQAPNRYDPPVACGKPGLALEAEDGRPLAPVRLLAVRRKPEARTFRAIAHTLACELRDFIGNGAWLVGEKADPAGQPTRRRLDFRDVQVLVAKKRDGLQMAEALREVGVPSAFYKQDGLFQSEEAQDLLDVLRAVERPGDPGRLARALVTPFFAYAAPELDALPELPEDHPVRERLGAWRELAGKRAFAQLLDRMLHDSGLAVRLRLARQGDRALTNHLHLAELLAAAAREGSPDLADLVRLLGQWVAGAATPAGDETVALQRLEAEPDAVQILTMHASKGLEAPVVALFGFTGPDPRLKVHRYHDDQGRRCVWLGARKGPAGTRIEAEDDREAERLLYVALTRAEARLLLPCFLCDSGGKEPKAIHPKGPYRVLNPVLRSVVDGGEAPELFESTETLRRDPDQRPLPPRAPDLSGHALAVTPRGGPAPEAYEAARAAARPVFTTSYTRLKAADAARHDPGLERHGDQDQSGLRLPAGDLPGGAVTGQLLHTLLEELDLEAVREGAFEAWWTPERVRWAGAIFDRYRFDRAFLEPAARKVFAAVHVPLPDRHGAAPLLVHDPGRLVRELDFLASYFGTPDFLTGAMDVVFQREGLVYILDWKSDSLAAFGPEALEAHVRERYDIQLKVYTWVILRWLRIEREAEYEARFGGFHYVFLRGLPADGVWFHRPGWAEVVRWRQDLLALHEEYAHA